MIMSPGVPLLPIVALLPATAAAQTVTATPVDTLLTAGPAAYDASRQQAVMLRQTVLYPPIFSTRSCDLAVWNGADWVPLLPPVTLPMRGSVLVYDRIRDQLLAFDGGTELRTVVDTRVSPNLGVPSPAPFYSIEGRSLVHEPGRDELVVFGGSHSQPTGTPWLYVTVHHDDTFVQRQGVWYHLAPTTRPAGRTYFALVHDPVRQRTVLYGGWSSSAFADTWEWDGTTWTQVPVTGPAAGSATGTFDPSSQRVVVRDAVGEVWAFDGLAWTAVGSSSAPRLLGATIVDDGQSLLLTGGSTPGYPSRSLIESWRLLGGGWAKVPTSVHMENGHSAVMAYDSTRLEMLFLHGNPASVPGWPAHTWTWNGAWREHPGPCPDWGGMAFDTARGEVVLFGGRTGGETWTWNGAAWTQRAPSQSPPPEPQGATVHLAADPVRQVVVLVGSGGTWLWDGTNWSPAPTPQPAPGTLLVWDPVRAAVVLSGIAGTNETWEWRGQWQLAAAATGPLGVFCAAFDPTRGRTFAYEQNTEHEWTGTGWVARPLPVPLQLQYARSMATDSDRGRVLFRGVVAPAQGIQLHVLGPTPSHVGDAGGGCATGLPLVAEGRPSVGATVRFVGRTDPGALMVLGLAFQTVNIPVGACTLVVDGSLATSWRLADATGRADLSLTFPPMPVFRGVGFHVQAVALPASGLQLSHALRCFVGD